MAIRRVKDSLGARRGLLGGLTAGLAAGLAILLAVSATAASPTLALTATDATIGQTIQVAAQLAESPDASGEISFEVFGPADPGCVGPALTPAPTPAVVSGEGQYLSGEFAPTEAGAYHWSAHYTGDENNPAAESICAATSTVDKASPGLTGSAGSGAVNTKIRDEVSLSGGFSPTGQVTFSVYEPGDNTCTTTPLETTVAPLSGGHATSTEFLTPRAGQFRWTATYSGDANNKAIGTACGDANQTSTVSKAAPTLTGVATFAVTVGLTITDSVTLTGSFGATGNLLFRAFGPGDETCATTPAYVEAVTVSGDGSYSPAGFAPPPGLYHWTVEYGGDANNLPASTACGANNQASTVSKAAPTLTGIATSAATVGLKITDTTTLAGSFGATGNLLFRAFGPGDETCATTPAYVEAVTVSGDGSYSPAGFAPPPGLYHWTVEYGGDANNLPASTACGDSNQASAVGTISIVLTAGAGAGRVGEQIGAAATIRRGAIPSGEITFRAFLPGDTTCAGTPAFTATAAVAGNGDYRSAAFAPSRVGTYRWTVAYSGDPNHAAATVGCGTASSEVSPAQPTLAGAVKPKLTVGTTVKDWTVLQGGYAPTGTITFRIYGPVAAGCGKPLFVDTVAVHGNGSVSSDPFVPRRPGRYSFVTSYSGDAANQATTEPCDSAQQVTIVQKRAPKLRPSGLLVGRTISIRAVLSGGFSPSGVVNFRLFPPGDRLCRGRPAFSGAISVRANGRYSLAQYFATKSGIYRLSVGYSGDQGNRPYRGSCGTAQPIRVG